MLRYRLSLVILLVTVVKGMITLSSILRTSNAAPFFFEDADYLCRQLTDEYYLADCIFIP